MAEIDNSFGVLDKYLGKQVTVKLFGAWREGIVVEILDSVCASMTVIVELNDGNKQIKVCCSYRCVRIKKDAA